MASRLQADHAMKIAGDAILADLAQTWEALPTGDLLQRQLEVVSKAARELGYADPLTTQDFAEIGTWANLANIDIEVVFE